MQVGIGTGNESLGFVGDHELWRLPEDDDELNVSPGDRAYFVKHRPVFRAAAPGEPISPNLAGRVSAAFGLASQLAAQDGDRDRAQALLDKGASLLAAARTVDVGQLLTALPHAYYPEHSWHDDMELGAVELAIAAQLLGDARELAWTEQAVRWAQAYIASGAPDTLNVYDTSALAHVELAGLLLRQGGSAAQFAGALTDDVRRKLDLGAARAASEPFGSAIDLTEFDAVPRSLGFAATAELYCRLTGDQRYAAFGSQQTHWVLGANPWGVSFVVGSGREVPRCVHHQVANLRGPGGDGFLRGAVINGPNAAGLFDDLDELPRGCKPCGPGSADRFAPYDTASARFVDDVRAWASAEPAIDFVSTAILAFALRAE
jgi:hypothetical protein